MPLYEYACEDCGKKCEVLQKIYESNPQNCPNCGKLALQRVVSNFGTKLPGLDSRQELRKRLPKSQPQTNGTAVTHSHGPACGHSSGFSQRLKQYEKRM
ncbi:MAG: zinc ribbon domain-containing protein [SAR324 cluster bacterium]|nr:zinc ribbon domain-containing protein [SAR324 cluster bacterium]